MLQPDVASHEKQCSKCRHKKPASEFFKNLRGKFGVRADCKVCATAAASVRLAKWRKENKERYLAHAKSWITRNPEKVRAIQKANYEKNWDATRAVGRKHYLANKDRIQRKHKAWRALNPEKVLADVRRRQAIKLHAAPKWADLKVIAGIYKRAREVWLETGIKMHVDHVIPLRHKLVCGLHVEQNLQILPSYLNSMKSNSFQSHSYSH